MITKYTARVTTKFDRIIIGGVILDVGLFVGSSFGLHVGYTVSGESVGSSFGLHVG